MMRPLSEIPDFKPAKHIEGAAVWFWERGSWRSYRVASVHAFQDAVTIRNGVGERIVRSSEILSNAQHDAEWEHHKALLRKDREGEARQKYAQLIKWWSDGLRRDDIAKKTGQPKVVVASQIAACVRLGFIELDADAKPPID